MMIKQRLRYELNPVTVDRIRLLPVLAVVCFFSLGMGGAGQIVGIPEPVNNYAVTITDVSGLSMRLEKFTVAGKTFFSGKFGRAEAAVDFQKIDLVTIESVEKTAVATLNLTNGTTIELHMPGETICYGESTVALIRIKLADIAGIQVHGLTKSDS